MSRSVPRNRTARSAVLGLPVRRPAPRSLSSRNTSALRRRIVLGTLVLLALALITASFRESSDGPLHDAQGAVASALQPLEVGVERVARPFRDAYGWTKDLFNARSENEDLKAENELLKQQVIQNESALQQNVVLKRLLEYRDSPSFPADYRRRRGRGDRTALVGVRAGDRRHSRLGRRRPRQRGGRDRGRVRRHGHEGDGRRRARAPAHRRAERRLLRRPAHAGRRRRRARRVRQLARARPGLEARGRPRRRRDRHRRLGAPARWRRSIRRGSRSDASPSSAGSAPTSGSRCWSSRTSTSRPWTPCSCSCRGARPRSSREFHRGRGRRRNRLRGRPAAGDALRVARRRRRRRRRAAALAALDRAAARSRRRRGGRVLRRACWSTCSRWTRSVSRRCSTRSPATGPGATARPPVATGATRRS